ncbi:MAG: heparinase, partial [Planctomycetota bacterium]
MPLVTLLVLLCLLPLTLSASELPSVDMLRDRATGFRRPRLLLCEPADPAALRARLTAGPLRNRAVERLLQTADAMCALPAIERVKKGKRMLGTSRLALRRILVAALAHRLTGEERHLALARREMLAAAGFRDWNPSHFLDVGEMCAALAIGYDWLHESLTPAERDRIAAALIEKGLRAVPRRAWWLKTTSNWNQVCHGGLSLAAIAVWEREPELAARTLRRALERIPHSMELYAPDGAYPEGPTYWRYGTVYNVLFLEALRTAFGDTMGLSAHAGFMRSADFYLHSAGTSGRFFNYGDTNVKKSWRPSPSMFWFARTLERPQLLARERDLLAAELDQPIIAEDNDFRFFPLLLLWAPDLAAVPPPA